MNKREEDPRVKGDIAEKLFELECIKRDIPIFAPVSGGSRIDYIIEIDGVMKKVQIKYISAYEGKVNVSFVKNQNGRTNEDGSRMYKKYTTDEIDLFFVYCPDTNEWYNVPMDKSVTNRCFVMRITPAKNNQTVGVNNASEFVW